MEVLLRNIGLHPYTVTLDPSVRFVWVKRRWMSKIYGGSAVAITPEVSATRDTPYRDFLYINVAKGHPNGPRAPGMNGLCYMEKPVQDNGSQDEIKRVFVNLGDGKWLYVGQYKLSPSPPLPTSNWILQSSAVRIILLEVEVNGIFVN